LNGTIYIADCISETGTGYLQISNEHPGTGISLFIGSSIDPFYAHIPSSYDFCRMKALLRTVFIYHKKLEGWRRKLKYNGETMERIQSYRWKQSPLTLLLKGLCSEID
jgi:hypothetical protein